MRRPHPFLPSFALVRVLILCANSHTIVQFSVVAIMPTAIIVTDLGGLALARRLRRRVEENDSSLLNALEPRLPESPMIEQGDLPPVVGEQLQLGRGAAANPARGLSAPEKVGSSPTPLAGGRSHRKSPPTRAQARAKVTLQKAANELLAVRPKFLCVPARARAPARSDAAPADVALYSLSRR